MFMKEEREDSITPGVLHLRFLAMNPSMAREESEKVGGHVSAAWAGLAWPPDYRHPRVGGR